MTVRPRRTLPSYLIYFIDMGLLQKAFDEFTISFV